MKTNSQHNDNFLALANTSSEAIVVVNASGKIEFVNPAYEKLTGQTLACIRGKKFEYSLSVDEGDTKKVELSCGQNSPVFAEMKVTEFTWNQQPAHLITLNEITTDQKIRDKVSKLSLVARQTNNGVILTDKNNNITWINKGFERISGYSLEEVKGKNPRIFQGPDTNPKHKQRIRKKLKELVPFTQEILNYHKNGTPYWIELRITPVFDDHGDIEMFIGIQSDVTGRKRAEKALQQSEKKFTTAFSSMPAGMLITNMAGEVQEINDAMLQMTGYKRDEILDSTMVEIGLIYAEQRSHLLEKIEMAGGSIRNVETTLQTKTGDTIHVLVSIKTIELYGESLRISTAINITERVKSKERLKEAWNIINNSNSVAFSWKNEKGWPVEYVSDNVEKLLGYDKHDLISGRIKYADCIHPDDLPRVISEVKAHSTSGASEFDHTPYRLVTKSGTIKWLSDFTFIQKNKQGDITHFKGILQDITQRKRVEDALSRSEKRFRSIFEIATLGIVQVDPKTGNILLTNSFYEQITGYSQKELLNMSFQELTHPEDRARDWAGFTKAVQDSSSYRSEKRYLRKDGTVIWVRLHVAFILDEHNNPIRTVAICEDITERREMSFQLKERVKELRAFYRLSHLTENRNATIENILGEMANYLPKSMWFPDICACQIVNGDEVYQSENFKSLQSSIKTPIKVNGKETGFLEIGYLKPPPIEEKRDTFLDEEIEMIHAIVERLSHVIERIHAQEALKESKKNLQITLNSIGDGVIATDTDGVVVQMNPVAEQLTGWRLQDAVGKKIEDVFNVIHAHTGLPAKNPVEKVLSTGKIVGLHQHAQLISKLGQTFQISNRAAPITADDGTIAGTVMVFHDVTETYKMREELKQSAKKFKAIFNNINDAVFLHRINPNNTPGRFIEVNDVACNMLGYSREELLSMSPADIDDPEYTDRKLKSIMDKLLAEGDYTFNASHRTKDRKTIPAEINSHLFELNGEQVVLSVSRDISDRIKQEEALKASEETQRAMIDSAPLGIIRIDRSGVIQTWNRAAENIFGWKEDEVIGKKVPFIPDDKKHEFIQLRNKVLFGEHFSNYEVRRLHKDGWLIDLSFSTAPIRNTHGDIVSILAIFSDITEQKKSEQQLKLQGAALDSAANAIVITDVKGNIEWVNTAWTKLTGYQPDEVIGKNPRILKSGQHSEEYYEDLWNTLLQNNVWSNELINKKKDGTYYHEFQTITPLTNEKGDITHFIAIKQDITERKKMEEELREAVKEKTALYQELYHRTRNNMQIIGAMLSLQNLGTNNKQLEKITHDINSRIRAMSLVHEKLYKSKSLSHIDFKDYIKSLYNELRKSHVTENQEITIELDIPDLELLIDIISPCGLILNELFSNSLEHSFPNGKSGTISLHISVEKPNTIKIHYSDDGVGLPEDFTISKNAGMGLELVKMLVEYQLNGTFDVIANGGFSCAITFSNDKYTARV